MLRRWLGRTLLSDAVRDAVRERRREYYVKHRDAILAKARERYAAKSADAPARGAQRTPSEALADLVRREWRCDVATSDLLNRLCQVVEDKRGADVNVIDLRGRSPLCNFLLVATGTSTRHVGQHPPPLSLSPTAGVIAEEILDVVRCSPPPPHCTDPCCGGSNRRCAAGRRGARVGGLSPPHHLL
jgi:hypothetical protein